MIKRYNNIISYFYYFLFLFIFFYHFLSFLCFYLILLFLKKFFFNYCHQVNEVHGVLHVNFKNLISIRFLIDHIPFTLLLKIKILLF